MDVSADESIALMQAKMRVFMGRYQVRRACDDARRVVVLIEKLQRHQDFFQSLDPSCDYSRLKSQWGFLAKQ